MKTLYLMLLLITGCGSGPVERVTTNLTTEEVYWSFTESETNCSGLIEPYQGYERLCVWRCGIYENNLRHVEVTFPIQNGHVLSADVLVNKPCHL